MREWDGRRVPSRCGQLPGVNLCVFSAEGFSHFSGDAVEAFSSLELRQRQLFTSDDSNVTF
jgi:hypothetical protein